MDDDHTLLGPYLLDALDDLERARFERHLVICGSCAAETASLRGAVAELGATLGEPVPAALRGRLLAAAADTPQERPPAVLPPVRRRWWVTAAVAAAVAVIAGIGGTVWQQQDDDRPTAAELLAAADVEVHAMATEMGMVEVGMSHESGMIGVDGSGLAEPGPMVYQLWFYTPDGPVSAGVLDDDVGAVVPMRTGSLVLTMEPAGGSPRPTGHELLTVPVSEL